MDWTLFFLDYSSPLIVVVNIRYVEVQNIKLVAKNKLSNEIQ